MPSSRDPRLTPEELRRFLAAASPDDRFDARGPGTPEDERLEAVRDEQLDLLADAPRCFLDGAPCVPDCDYGAGWSQVCSRPRTAKD